MRHRDPVLAVPPEVRSEPFRGSRAIRDGVRTPRQLRGRSWQRLFTDVYLHQDVQLTHELRVRAAAGLLQPDAVVTGRSAAVLWGVPLAGPRDDVELTRPRALLRSGSPGSACAAPTWRNATSCGGTASG